MPTIEQDIAAIRTAVYGRDVREAIADGFEHCRDGLTDQEDIRKCLVATNTKYANGPITQDGDSETVVFNVYALAGTQITIKQKTGRIAANGAFNVVLEFADNSSGESVAYGGVYPTSQQFSFTAVPTNNISRVTLTMNGAGVGGPKHKFEITYTPGADKIASEKDSLTLYDSVGDVTVTAAQLRQLLNLIS